jgi:predicted cupin superfamily sugar epimerase
MVTAKQLITQYQLQTHPEGGWYKETYKSTELIAAAALPQRFNNSRFFSTAIYFLLEQGNFSAFHRIKSDECWHFYSGDPLMVYVLQPDGLLQIIELGNDILNGQVFQYVVPANCWFASRPAVTTVYSFVGCTVAPAFDFADFELADANVLVKEFPQHSKLIHQLCR